MTQIVAGSDVEPVNVRCQRRSGPFVCSTSKRTLLVAAYSLNFFLTSGSCGGNFPYHEKEV